MCDVVARSENDEYYGRGCSNATTNKKLDPISKHVLGLGIDCWEISRYSMTDLVNVSLGGLQSRLVGACCLAGPSVHTFAIYQMRSMFRRFLVALQLTSLSRKIKI